MCLVWGNGFWLPVTSSGSKMTFPFESSNRILKYFYGANFLSCANCLEPFTRSPVFEVWSHKDLDSPSCEQTAYLMHCRVITYQSLKLRRSTHLALLPERRSPSPKRNTIVRAFSTPAYPLSHGNYKSSVYREAVRIKKFRWEIDRINGTFRF